MDGSLRYHWEARFLLYVGLYVFSCCIYTNKKKSALIISIHVLIEVLQLNGSHESVRQFPLRACPPCEGNSTPSPRLAGRLQLFFKHKP